MHPPQMHGPGPLQGLPGARSPGAPGPIDAIPVQRMNEMYMQQNQAVSDRLEADARGYDSVFAQWEVKNLYVGFEEFQEHWCVGEL